ncbi:MAG TPA: nuclear transport factor 2 family protein [Pseudomonadales bacterium]
MDAFASAKGFFQACEAPEGWSGCRQYVADGATFSAQADPLTDVRTVEAYCEWMKQFGTVIAPGATYDLHSASFDERTRTAVFFATFHAKHSGEGGPMPPTGRETHTDYVYVLQMNDAGQVAQMTKIWNANWAMRELGWL